MGGEGETGVGPEAVDELQLAGLPSMAWVTSVLSENRTSIRPVSAAMVGSAPSMRPSPRMVSIRSRLLE
jgi:hypothetical protein